MMKWTVILILISQLVKQSLSETTTFCNCQAEIVKYKNNYLQCTVSKSCQKNCGLPVMKVLTQSSANVSSTTGKLIKLNNDGILVALCYIKVDDSDCSCDYDWIVRTYRINTNQQSDNNRFSIKEFGEHDEPNFNVNDFEVNVGLVSQPNDSFVVSCRHTYTVNKSQELHQLFRILPNKESFKVLIDVENIKGKISYDTELVTIEYKHEFKYDAEYLNNRFECRFVDKFMEHSQSHFTKSILKETKCNRLKIGYKNNSLDMNETFEKMFNRWPTRLTCSCSGVAYPEPQIFWTTNFSSYYRSGMSFDNYVTENSNSIFCCHSKQIFLSGMRHTIPSCFMPQDASGYPWIVIQRRMDGSVLFNRTWCEYKNGFGNFWFGEYWLGNDRLHELTSAAPMKIRFDLWHFEDNHVYAEYSTFSVASESDNYRLSIGGYSGTAGDAMNPHNNMQFSTYDRDNDAHTDECSRGVGGYGGWWFKHCFLANLNGYYDPHTTGSIGRIDWKLWADFEVRKSPTKVIIKIAYK